VVPARCACPSAQASQSGQRLRANVLEQLQDAQDDVVDVAEARALRLLGVVQAAGPVDRDVAQPMIQTTDRVWLGHRHRRMQLERRDHRAQKTA
jgi:hypothetical protein